MPGPFTHIYTARRVADLLQSGQFDAHTVQPGRRPRVCVFDVGLDPWRSDRHYGHAVPWLQQRTGVRGQFPAQAVATGAVPLTAPRDLGGGIGDPAPHHEVAADNQQVGLTTSDQPPAPGEAHVYRVTASQHGQVFGGYTVALLG